MREETLQQPLAARKHDTNKEENTIYIAVLLFILEHQYGRIKNHF